MNASNPTLVSPKAYRQLSPAELALMDELNAHREATRDLVNRVEQFCQARDSEPLPGGDAPHPVTTHPSRWVSIGRTDLQTGYMSLARAIAQPSFF